MSVHQPYRNLAILLTALLLTACGGGGGAASSPATPVTPVTPADPEPPMPTGPITVSGQEGLSVSLDQSSLRMVGIKGVGMPESSITFTLDKAPVAGTLYAKASADKPTSFSFGVSSTGDKSMSVRIVPVDPAVGIGSGRFTFKLCTDVNCNSVVWTTSIPYQTKMFSVSAAALDLTGFQGITTVDKSLLIEPADTLNELDITAVTSAESPNWLSAKFASASALEVSAAGSGLAQGRHIGSFSVSTHNANPLYVARLQIPVAFTTGPGMILPANKEIELNGATAAKVSDTIAIAFNGGQTPAWKATSNRPWLVLSTAQGSGPGMLGYTIDATQLDALDNFTSDTAHIIVSASGLDDTTIDFKVNKKLPEIEFAAPNGIAALTATKIRVRGRGLQQLQSIDGIHIAGATGVTGSIVSDTEAQLFLPAMPAGRYAVSIPSASGLIAAQDSLTVAPVIAFDAARISTSGIKPLLVFNPARSALYIIDQTRLALDRYRLTAGTWQKDLSVPVTWGSSLGMSPDGETIYTTSDSGSLDERSADTLAIRSSYPTPAALNVAYGHELKSTVDHRLWFGQSSPLMYFDTVGKKFLMARNGVDLILDPEVTVSADGTRMFVLGGQGIGNPSTVLRYDAFASLLEQRINPPDLGTSNLLLTGNGKKMQSTYGTTYDTDTYEVLSYGSSENFAAIFLSNDGSRMYRTAAAQWNILVLDHIDVFDTVAKVKLGEIPLPSGVVSCGATDYNCNWRGVFAMSPFDNVIFWAGNQGIAVVPIPSVMLPPAATALQIRPARPR